MKVDMERLIEAVAATLRAHADDLTSLDQAIGDGDHGINMKRGFDAVADAKSDIVSLGVGAALQKIGMTLVMKVGGASGPLYGTLLMTLGKHWPAELNTNAVHAALGVAITALKKRGRSDVGEKTMLDVLAPVHRALASERAVNATFEQLLEAVTSAADMGLETTREMQATKGRASFLGERSVGHLDPGARSSQLIVRTICGVLGDKT